MNVTELGEQEKEIAMTLRVAKGSTEERLRHLQLAGVFERYKAIHAAYCKLSANDSEALKRAIFLSWFSTIEPPELLGIKDLSKVAEQELEKNMEATLKTKKADYELQWMLSYYASAEPANNLANSFGNLFAKLRTAPVSPPSSIDLTAMESRGLMGVYWANHFFFSEGL